MLEDIVGNINEETMHWSGSDITALGVLKKREIVHSFVTVRSLVCISNLILYDVTLQGYIKDLVSIGL
jgi:hypothetical protein